jgi:hypothetical protein
MPHCRLGPGKKAEVLALQRFRPVTELLSPCERAPLECVLVTLTGLGSLIDGQQFVLGINLVPD